MTPDAQRAYVRNWVETGRLLQDIRWQELRALDPATALRVSDALIAAACLVAMPPGRKTSSGLAALQDLLHRRRQP
jgi:hypothetical protein